jgi:hypothetical protein
MIFLTLFLLAILRYGQDLLADNGAVASGVHTAFVQVQGKWTNGGATTVSVNISPTSNNFLYACVRQGSNNTDTMPITDSASQTWTQVAAGYVSEDSLHRSTCYFKKQTAAITSVTINFSTGTVASPTLIVMEISGLANQAEDSSVGSTSSTAVTSLTSGSLTTSNANDILIYFVQEQGTATSWTAGTNFTIPNNNDSNGNSGSTGKAAIQYSIVSAKQTGVTTNMSWAPSNPCAGIFAGIK